jgi:serine/threonine protein kinase
MAVGCVRPTSPPEVLRDPRAPRTPAADVYAFGVVLLELLAGAPAWPRGLRGPEVAAGVLRGLRPDIPPGLGGAAAAAAAGLRQLIAACWAQDPAARPGFVTGIVPQLQALLNCAAAEAAGAATLGAASNTAAVSESGGSVFAR